MAAAAQLPEDLTSIAAVAAVLEVEQGDAKLPRLISAASEAVRQYINRPRVHYGASITELARGYGRPRLLLNVTPILTIASITLPDGSLVDPSEYMVEDADAGMVYRAAGWPFTGQLHGGLLYVDPVSGSERPSISVVYAGGWVTPAQAATTPGLPRSLPYDLEEAVIMTVVARYRGGGVDPNVASESLGDYSVSYRNPNTLIGVGGGGIIPDAAARILDSYARPAG